MKPQTNLQKNLGIFFGVIIACGVLSITIFYANQSSNTPSTTSQNTNTVSNPVSSNTNPSQNISTSSNPTATPIAKPTPTPVASQTPPASTTPSYSFMQVSSHSSASSCWTIIGNNVYDLTSWINQHPGGKQAILGLCGKDGTIAFEKQHGGQARPQSELKSFYIGTYAK